MFNLESMVDQASGLRRLFAGQPPQVLGFAATDNPAISSTLVLRTARALADAGHAVTVIDESSPPHKLSSLCNQDQRHDLLQALNGRCALRQLQQAIAPGLNIVAAERAAREFDERGYEDSTHLTSCLNELQRGMEFVLINCAQLPGGGLSRLATAAREVALTVAAQPEAITQAYSRIKQFARLRKRDGFKIVITHTTTEEEARRIFGNMRRTAREHLQIRLDFLGYSNHPAEADLCRALIDGLNLRRRDKSMVSGFFLETQATPRIRPQALRAVTMQDAPL